MNQRAKATKIPTTFKKANFYQLVLSPAFGMIADPCHSSSEEMIAEIYGELRRLASIKLSNLPPGQTLQPTALVHEVYLRLSAQPSQRWENRGHFFASASEAMRRILVDQARRKSAQRRPPGELREPLDKLEVACPSPDERLLAVHAVLDEFERIDPAQAQIVKWRFFAGLKHQEIAVLLGISEKTVRRQWNHAKLWLYERIKDQLSS